MGTFFDGLERILPRQRVLRDHVSLLAYECDAFPLHRHPPLAVVFPHSTAEVSDVLRHCHAHGIAVHIPKGHRNS